MNAIAKVNFLAFGSAASQRRRMHRSPVEPSGRDRAFFLLSTGYRTFGGLARGTELADRWPNGGLSWLARRIASREVISFEWRGDLWLPLFQFAALEPKVALAARTLITELAPVLDDWELAQWFTSTNAWLDNLSPLEMIRDDFERVQCAARAHRFACQG